MPLRQDAVGERRQARLGGGETPDRWPWHLRPHAKPGGATASVCGFDECKRATLCQLGDVALLPRHGIVPKINRRSAKSIVTCHATATRVAQSVALKPSWRK